MWISWTSIIFVETPIHLCISLFGWRLISCQDKLIQIRTLFIYVLMCYQCVFVAFGAYFLYLKESV